jgi:hypothetical protein
MAQSSVVLQATIRQDAIRAGMPTEIDVRLKNETRRDIFVYGRVLLFFNLSVTLIDSSGEAVEYPGSGTTLMVIPPSSRDDFVKLAPDNYIGKSIVFRGTVYITKPGQYTMRIGYSDAGISHYASRFRISLAPLPNMLSIPITIN